MAQISQDSEAGTSYATRTDLSTRLFTLKSPKSNRGSLQTPLRCAYGRSEMNRSVFWERSKAYSKLEKAREEFAGVAFYYLREGVGVERGFGADVDGASAALPCPVDEVGRGVDRA